MNDFVVKQLVGGMPDLARRLEWWVSNFKFRISQAVERLRTGKDTLAEFHQFGRDELRDTYYGIAETGKGASLTAKERAEIRRRTLKEQLGYWDRFCQDIADQRKALQKRKLKGDELEEAYNAMYAKFSRRAQSYAGAIEAEGERWAMAGMYKDGQWFQWQLGEAEHCKTCLDRDDTIAQMKDGRLSYYSRDGSTICLYNCRCRWQPISRFKAMALRALGKLKQIVGRK